MTVTFLVGGQDDGPHELEFWVCEGSETALTIDCLADRRASDQGRASRTRRFLLCRE